MAHTLLLDMMTALGRLQRLESAQIKTSFKNQVVLGLCEGGRYITINEGQLIVPTLSHELIHAVNMGRSEHGVNCLTAAVLRSMTEDEVEHVYRLYLKAKERHRFTPKNAE